METMELSIRILTREELPGFRQYLLPATAAALERGGEDMLAIGAVTGRYACGAAAARLEGEDGALLTDLFVDAAIRRQGVGSFLLKALTGELAAAGCGEVTADYALEGESLTAMDALLVKSGFSEPVVQARSFRAVSEEYRDAPIIRRAFSSGYRTPEGVVSFDRLSQEALEELEAADDIPYFLSWPKLKGRALPDMSVALVQDGKAAAYQLAEESADGGFVLLSAVNRKDAPPSAFLTLFLELVNRCVYRAGGCFPFYFSVINDHVERLARKLMGGRCTEYEEHVCFFPLDETGQEENFV